MQPSDDLVRLLSLTSMADKLWHNSSQLWLLFQLNNEPSSPLTKRTITDSSVASFKNQSFLLRVDMWWWGDSVVDQIAKAIWTLGSQVFWCWQTGVTEWVTDWGAFSWMHQQYESSRQTEQRLLTKTEKQVLPSVFRKHGRGSNTTPQMLDFHKCLYFNLF